MAKIVFLAWTHVSARQMELAREFQGVAVPIPGASKRGGLMAIHRYATSAVKSWRILRIHRPEVIVTTCPPLFAGWMAWMYCAVHGSALVLDSHPGAFGLMGDRLSKRLQGLHRFLIRRAFAVAVTTPRLVDHVEDLGGRGLILHEPAPSDDLESGPAGRFVLFPGSGARDEPYELVIEAARHAPETHFVVTGSPPRELESPPNVDFVGYVAQVEFERLMSDARVVLCLSTDGDSVMRTAYEAVYRKRPLVISDFATNREFFPYATFVRHDPGAIAQATEVALLAPRLDDAANFSRAAWKSQRLDFAAALERARNERTTLRHLRSRPWTTRR